MSQKGDDVDPALLGDPGRLGVSVEGRSCGRGRGAVAIAVALSELTGPVGSSRLLIRLTTGQRRAS
jgi:hypothetical protein